MFDTTTGEDTGQTINMNRGINFDLPEGLSPAQIRLTSVGSGRSFEAGRVNLEVLERSFWG